MTLRSWIKSSLSMRISAISVFPPLVGSAYTRFVRLFTASRFKHSICQSTTEYTGRYESRSTYEKRNESTRTVQLRDPFVFFKHVLYLAWQAEKISLVVVIEAAKTFSRHFVERRFRLLPFIQRNVRQVGGFHIPIASLQ